MLKDLPAIPAERFQSKRLELRTSKFSLSEAVRAQRSEYFLRRISDSTLKSGSSYELAKSCVKGNMLLG